MNARIVACLFCLVRHAATLALALGFTAPAMAQWKHNPVVEWEDTDYPNLAINRCRLEIDGCAFSFRTGGPDIGIARTDRNGFVDAEAYWSDPVYGPVLGPWWKQNHYSYLVGCNVAPREFMLAYSVAENHGSIPPPGDAIRVTRIHWNPSNDQFETMLGFPVTISNEQGTGLAITPNITSTGIDGVIVAWEAGGSVHQQGVYNSHLLVWPGAPVTGVLVDANTNPGSSPAEAPSIVSTGDGMAVTTYHKFTGIIPQHWSRKVDLDSLHPGFSARVVPGQGPASQASLSRCCVASDELGGAFYGFATEPTDTTLVASHLDGSGTGQSLPFWFATSASGASGYTPLLRALSFLTMPGSGALLTYRDRDGIRCLQFTFSTANGLQMGWTQFVRGATSATNDDDADSVMHAGTVCIATVSDADVETIGFDTSGVAAFPGHRHNDPNATPPKLAPANRPARLSVWATGSTFFGGFMLGWYDEEGHTGNFIAERIRKNGIAGMALFTGLAGGGFQSNSAVLFDIQCADALRLYGFEFALGEPSGSMGMIEAYAAIGSSHVGIENTAAAWTLVGSGNIVSAGPGQLSSVTMSAPFVLPAGTNALLLRGVGVALGSTTAIGNTSTFVFDNLTVQCGAHVANWPNGPAQSARVFQGSMSFEGATVPQNPGANTVYGVGCYSQSDSFYSRFADAATAAPALSGQSMTLLLLGSQYQVTWGGGSFVPPTTPPLTGFLPNGDDGVVTITLPTPMVFPGGVTTQLVVHSNGNVWVGDNRPSLANDDYTPRPAAMLAAPYAGWWSWHDYNLDEPGSGQVFAEDVLGVQYVTWMGAESYPLGVSNPSYLQFQFDTNTGSVTYVWSSLDGNSASEYGSGHLVGYSPGGASVDGGSLDLAVVLPLQTTVGMFPLTLSASPAPIAGTTVTYTTSNIPETTPGSGLYLAMQILSLGSTPGIDLGFLGAPGCSLHVASLDFTQVMIGTTPELSMSFTVPAGVPAGTTIYAQSVALFMPGSLANGGNALGLTTSNGVQTRIGN